MILPSIEILTAEELVEKLERLYLSKAYFFRGQPDEKFYLLPSAFRDDVIMRRLREYPASSSYQQWCMDKEFKKLIPPPLTEDYINSLHVQRMSELTFYLMHYNYFLAKHVERDPKKFDSATINMYKVRPSSYWHQRETFLYLFGFGFNLSIGRKTLDGKVINHSLINEEMAAYDESLPQHYDTQTAAIDFTYNPYIAIYFALQNISSNARYVSVYAYKHLQDSEKNPIIVESTRPECENLRIVRQEGLFLRIRYACSYYFTHGSWPTVENFLSRNAGMFELIKFKIPVSETANLQRILIQKNITKEYLFPDSEKSIA